MNENGVLEEFAGTETVCVKTQVSLMSRTLSDGLNISPSSGRILQITHKDKIDALMCSEIFQSVKILKPQLHS